MIALAFLQNMWVRDPDRVRALIEKHGEEYRTRFADYLENGVFGESHLDAIKKYCVPETNECVS